MLLIIQIYSYKIKIDGKNLMVNALYSIRCNLSVFTQSTPLECILVLGSK